MLSNDRILEIEGFGTYKLEQRRAELKFLISRKVQERLILEEELHLVDLVLLKIENGVSAPLPPFPEAVEGDC